MMLRPEERSGLRWRLDIGGQAHAADDRLAAEDLGVRGDPFESPHVILSHPYRMRPSTDRVSPPGKRMVTRKNPRCAGGGRLPGTPPEPERAALQRSEDQRSEVKQQGQRTRPPETR